jgi:Domain of unknown function (DUF5666)
MDIKSNSDVSVHPFAPLLSNRDHFAKEIIMKLKFVFNALVSAATALIASCAIAAAPDVQVVEYVQIGTEHYFMTGSDDDKRLLAQYPNLYAKTGRSFTAWSPAAAGKPAEAVAVLRFFMPSVASHVFTSHAADIALIRQYPASKFSFGFVEEGTAFFAIPATEDRCPSGMKAIYRAFNNRADANHRYSNDVKLQAAMVKRGFIHENVAFCSHNVDVDTSTELAAGTTRSSNEDITISGVVSSFVSISDFMLGTQKVNAGNARFDHGAPSALVNGVSVVVEGVVIDGVLVATEIKLPASTPMADDEFKGFVTALGSGGKIFVNGTAVDTSNAVVTGGTLAQIVVGTEVELHGAFISGTFVATRVHIEDGPNGIDTNPVGDSEIKGIVANFVSISNFTVNGQIVNAQNAVFEDGSAANLANGANVEVHGKVVSGVLVASRVEFKSVTPPPGGGDDPPDAIEFEATGTISAFTGVASFMVAGKTIDASAASFERGTAANLANGVLVEVKGSIVGGIVKATRVRFER